VCVVLSRRDLAKHAHLTRFDVIRDNYASASDAFAAQESERYGFLCCCLKVGFCLSSVSGPPQCTGLVTVEKTYGHALLIEHADLRAWHLLPQIIHNIGVERASATHVEIVDWPAWWEVAFVGEDEGLCGDACQGGNDGFVTEPFFAQASDERSSELVSEHFAAYSKGVGNSAILLLISSSSRKKKTLTSRLRKRPCEVRMTQYFVDRLLVDGSLASNLAILVVLHLSVRDYPHGGVYQDVTRTRVEFEAPVDATLGFWENDGYL
jgi:hypothetical protein